MSRRNQIEIHKCTSKDGLNFSLVLRADQSSYRVWLNKLASAIYFGGDQQLFDKVGNNAEQMYPRMTVNKASHSL